MNNDQLWSAYANGYPKGLIEKPLRLGFTKSLNWNMDAEKGEVQDKTNLDGAYADLLDQDYR